MFGVFLFELLRPRREAALRVDVRPYRWLVIGLITVQVFSNPNLNPIISVDRLRPDHRVLAIEREMLGRSHPRLGPRLAENRDWPWP